jgi:AraC-like DNA-binding protein
MQDNLTIVATWGRAIATALESYGCDSRPLFDELEMDPQLSYNPNAQYPLAKIYRLLQRAVEVTGDDAFGLQVSRFLPSTYVPALNILVAASDNMLQGFAALCRFHSAINNVFVLKLRLTQAAVFLEYEIAEDIKPLLPPELPKNMPAEAVDAGFGGMVENVRNSLDPNFTVRCVYFRHPKPDNSAAFDSLFRAPIQYDQPYDRLEFDHQTLTVPLVSANRELARINEQILQSLVKGGEREQFLTDVQLHIIDQLSKGEPRQEDIAGALNLSTRQLRRRLQQLDSSYARLLEHTRHDLARKYLLQQSLSVSDVTQLLGFSDQSNFSKAFKRWEGDTPINYRRKALSD